MLCVRQMFRKWRRQKPVPASEEPRAYTIPENRPLTPEERPLLEWLIANGNPDARAYAQQIDYVRVIGRCSCRCPTVDLVVDDCQEAITGPSHILANFIGLTPDGIQVGVLLHV